MLLLILGFAAFVVFLWWLIGRLPVSMWAPWRTGVYQPDPRLWLAEAEDDGPPLEEKWKAQPRGGDDGGWES
jgi:hypothetical protein